MAETPHAWDPLLESLEPHVSPEWMRHAREHGSMGWIRLILLVDAHNQLSSPWIAEKVAMTMVDLAGDRETEAAGWTEVQEKARDRRLEVAANLVDTAPEVLTEELIPLFGRSIEPTSYS